MARIPLNLTVNHRDCGACQACCTILGIQELGKPPHAVCPNQCEEGCAIYAGRPPTCAGYSCLWQLGILQGDLRRRPDQLGVIFDFRAPGSDRVRPEDPKVVQAWEVWSGAFQEPQAAYLLDRIAEILPLVKQPHPGSELTEKCPLRPQ